MQFKNSPKKRSMLCSSVCFLAFFSGLFPAVTHSEQVEVIILGAGVAGLSAAKILSDNNVTNFIILEGSNRIGGRIQNGRIGSANVEMGSNYIVGTTGNPIWNTAAKYNLSGIVTNYKNVVVVNADGTDVTNTEAGDAWTKLKIANLVVDKIFSDIETDKIEDMALGVGLNIGGWKADSPVKRALEWYESADFSFSTASDLISLKERKTFLRRLKIAGSDDEFFVSDQRGYVNVFNEMKNEFLQQNDDRLKLNEVITKIKYNDSEVTITTKANKTYSANYVIVTFGLGVLQNRLIEFEPPLPSWKEDNLFRINVGHAATIYVECSEEAKGFLNKKEYAVYASKNFGYFPVWTNMIYDGLLPKTSNIISSMMTGEQARRVERLGKSELKSEITKILREVNKNPNIAEPRNILVSDWSTNPLFMGSMSSLPPGFSEDRIQALKAPVGRLYFAGEAYHVMYRGFVRGAFYSGRNEAREILKCRQGSCKKYERPTKYECPTDVTDYLQSSFSCFLFSMIFAYLQMY